MSERPTLTVAAVQMCSGADPARNLREIAHWTAQAAQAGAQLVALPEMCTVLERRGQALLDLADDPIHGTQLQALQGIAQAAGVMLLVGSMAVRVQADRCANRSVLIDAHGQVRAQYDKIHLFDADLGPQQRYLESARIVPGTQAVCADLGDWRLGLSVCYDLRFAALYRDLALAGSDVIAVPSAFTVPTGQAHWSVLLRARAIETGAFILAPAQHGQHEDGRQTWGHSLIVGPLGEVLAERPADPGVLLAQLPLAEVARARQQLPSLQHARAFASAGSQTTQTL
ncbi:MAG: hypothetical protein RIQ38_102 [Pseudomonadota bacterium]